jgi:hypothetical protein
MSPSLPVREAIFWIAALLCTIAEIAILRSMLRGSRATAPDRSASVDANMPRGRPGAELVWAVLPAIGLIVILALTHGALR